MNRLKFGELTMLYRDALLRDVIPFWERHSVDEECGGYFTCLDRQGSVYDTDKFIWPQARQVWTFAMLYNRLEKKEQWLEIARHGVEFLRKYGMDAEGNWYFALNREGKPLVQPYNIFSDCFAAMAFSQYALASGDDDAEKIALKTYRNILQRRDNPKGKYSKVVPGTRPLKTFALPMILVNLSLEMEHLLNRGDMDTTVDGCLNEVMTLFLDRDRNLIFEHVLPDGSHPDCFDGRLINPGHGIESMWFAMDVAHRRNDKKLAAKAVDIVLSTLDFGWDSEYGGIFYFLDAEGKAPRQLEWDQKLWWVHLEALVALTKGYALTGHSKCLQWYEKVQRYAWQRFPDPEFGEWFGYLNRRGKVLLDIKGGMWKGCFHVPRALYLCYKEFQQMDSGK